MNKIQNKIAKEAKRIKKETKFSYCICKWAAKKRLNVRKWR
jgi:hypothetical protein